MTKVGAVSVIACCGQSNAQACLTMPLLQTRTLFGIVCNIYDGGAVKVGTNSKRFTLWLNATEDLFTKLRAALKKRGWSHQVL